MFYNYLKISLAVLVRRKFLTFVNLFGAVLTLTVLVVAFAILESVVSPAGAQHRQDRILTVLDTVIAGPNGSWGGGPGRAFFDVHIATLETPDLVSFATNPQSVASYRDGRKLNAQLRRTDATYWQILDFELLEGRLLAADDIDQGRFVAVINEATAGSYFPGRSAIGETIDAGTDSFEVVGVVANEPVTSLLAYSDIWVPLTTTVAGTEEWVGGGIAMLWFEDASRIGAAKAEYAESLEGFVYTPDPAEFERVVSSAMTALEMVATGIIGEMYRENGTPSAAPGTRVAAFMGLVSVTVLLFMALPAINMSNLNIGRILERAPEIGLRKATGASRTVLVGQFIFENVVLCAIGGLIAFALAPLVLGILNETVFPYGQLGLNLPVFVAGFGFVLLFGVLSGAYPALKMARLDPAAALRGMQHA